MNLIEIQWINGGSSFQTALSFQSNGIDCSKKVNGFEKPKPIAKQCDMKSDQLEAGTSKMEDQNSRSMSRKRYTELIRMASGKLTTTRVEQAKLRYSMQFICSFTVIKWNIFL